MRVSSSAAVRSNAGSVSSSVPGSRAGSRMLQWIACGVAGELGADLAHAVAEADDVVEAPAGELAEVLGAAAREVDPALAHHPHRVGMQRLGMAAGAGRAHRAAGQLLGERLGHLRARAVARAQEQHARARRAALAAARAAAAPRPGCSEAPALGEQLTAARQLEHVVGVAAVGGAAARRDEAAVAQLAQVVRDEALAPAGQLAQLADAPIAARQLAQQPPAQRMAGQPQERAAVSSTARVVAITAGEYINLV